MYTRLSLFAILQKYDFSSKSQHKAWMAIPKEVVCDTAKVRFFKQITTSLPLSELIKSCLRYCKSTIFQANHNKLQFHFSKWLLFAILQKYDFSSKSQPSWLEGVCQRGCLRYCKSTIFQANHNRRLALPNTSRVVCDTAKVRFFKQITITQALTISVSRLFAILQKYDFSSKSQPRKR